MSCDSIRFKFKVGDILRYDQPRLANKIWKYAVVLQTRPGRVFDEYKLCNYYDRKDISKELKHIVEYIYVLDRSLKLKELIDEL